VNPGAGYDAHATARWAAEAGKEGPPAEHRRGAFVRDRARVLHSAALRRLAAKTQVVGVGVGDFPRTRLTHSLECAQIGREFGAELGCDPDLVDAACLAHDLGHPPFGHNGEVALARLAASCGGFEGNAQSLRLLTRLEAKVPGAGLNLTRATLDGCVKYPWGAPLLHAPAGPPAKFGYYADDAAAYRWIKEQAPDGKLCLEAQVMDWADDIAYSVHDLEDGLHAGHITVRALHGAAERTAVTELARTRYLQPEAATSAELGEVFAGLLGLPFWPADLVVPRRQRLECALLKAVTAHFVMSREGVAARQAAERELIGELSAAVQAGAPGTLDPMLRPAYLAADTDQMRLRVVVDQIASLTDTSAIAWHDRLCRGRRPAPRNRLAGA